MYFAYNIEYFYFTPVLIKIPFSPHLYLLRSLNLSNIFLSKINFRTRKINLLIIFSQRLRNLLPTSSILENTHHIYWLLPVNLTLFIKPISTSILRPIFSVFTSRILLIQLSYFSYNLVSISCFSSVASLLLLQAHTFLPYINIPFTSL